MSKGRRIAIVVTLAGVAAAVYLFPALVYVPLGLLRQESFFRGKPTNYWIRALKKEGFMGHAPPTGDIGVTLREGGSEAVGVLCDIAQNSDEGLRLDALMTLKLIGPEAYAAAPLLAKTIKKEKDAARFLTASQSLAKANHKMAIATLIEVLRDRGNRGGRAWALAVLLELAPDCQQALPALREMLTDPDPTLRVQAVLVLWRMKQPSEPLVLILCDAACTQPTAVGCQALSVLGEMGTDAMPALPTLLWLLARPNLADVGPRWGPPHAAAIVRVLGSLGPQAADAISSLKPLLKSQNNLLFREVAQTLAKIEPPANNDLPNKN